MNQQQLIAISRLQLALENATQCGALDVLNGAANHPDDINTFCNLVATVELPPNLLQDKPDQKKTIKETPVQTLDAPNDLFTRLTSIRGKHFPGDFKSIVRNLKRPYYRLTEEQFEAVAKLADGSDVVLFDGTTQMTYGSADTGWALMPLIHPVKVMQ